MPRFFTDDPVTDIATITGEDARHISRSLRMKPGEALTLCDGRGVDHRCVISGFTADSVTLSVLESAPSAAEPPLPITLYQALPKADKLEFIVQKATELGACRIVPVLSARCVSRPDAKSMEKKRERLSRIALEAAKQSGRGVVPTVAPLLSFAGALSEMTAQGTALFFYELGGEPVSAALKNAAGPVSLMIGPEGGFDRAEAEAAQAAGAHRCTLGPRILRCETAPLAALAVVTDILETR